MKKQSRIRSSLRWFLFLWVGMTVASWLVENMFLGGLRSAARGQPVAVKSPLPLWLTLLFLLLVALYSFLLWMGISDRVQPRFFWWYFLGQGLLVFTLQMVGGPFNFGLDFYLALGLCALTMFKRVGPVLLIGAFALLLFVAPLGMKIFLPVPLGQAWRLFWSLSGANPMSQRLSFLCSATYSCISSNRTHRRNSNRRIGSYRQLIANWLTRPGKLKR